MQTEHASSHASQASLACEHFSSDPSCCFVPLARQSMLPAKASRAWKKGPSFPGWILLRKPLPPQGDAGLLQTAESQLQATSQPHAGSKSQTGSAPQTGADGPSQAVSQPQSAAMDGDNIASTTIAVVSVRTLRIRLIGIIALLFHGQASNNTGFIDAQRPL
ncbi:MAG: hypothetical protein AAF670_07575 [Planctomycetota bacterium]